MSLETDLDDLRARLELATRTLVLGVVPSDPQLEEVKQPLLEILRATPLVVADLGACTSSMGPARWAQLASAQPGAAVHVLSFVPPTELSARAFANLLNAERGLLSQLPGPLLLLVSQETERVLRRHAHDFFTWISHGYALPKARALLALMARLHLGTPEPEPAIPPETPIRFLHVSDFHLRPSRVSRYDQDRVLEGLLRFLERDGDRFPLDLVFVTGDLAWSGRPDEYALVVAFLRKLLELTGVPPERMFAVPGNHDVDRSVGRWLLRTLSSDDESIAFFTDPEARAFHRQKLAAYETSLREVLGPGRQLGLGVGADAVEIVEIAGSRLAIASFNSSWFSQGDGDQGKLWLGDPNLRGAAERIADADASFAISLLHHPFDYLHEDERELVEHRLELGFDLVLRGHLHANKTRSIASQRGGYVEVAAPASYQGSHWPNGCFLGEIRPKARTVRLRPYTFASGPDPWVLDTKVFPDDADDGYCRTFTVPHKQRRKSSMSRASRAAVQDAFDKASPHQQMWLKRRVLHDQGAHHDASTDRELVSRLAEESPELRVSLLKDSGVALVSAIESLGSLRDPALPQIDVTEAVGFERALMEAGRLFLEHTAKLALDRARMTERDANVGLAASLGLVVDAPIAVGEGVGRGYQADIMIGDKVDACDLVEVVRSTKAGLGPKLHQLDHFGTTGEVRHAALAVVGSLPEGATEPKLERVITPSGRGAWVVHL